MIINIRGTSGSGKTTAMRVFLNRIGGLESLERVFVDGRRQPLYYISHKYKFALLGHYETVCGGIDTISKDKTGRGTFTIIKDLISELHGKYHLLFEGLLMSGDVKHITEIQKEVSDIRVICLITPLEQCIKNIYQRREESGRPSKKPLNKSNIHMKHRLTESARQRLVEAGVYCRRVANSEQAAGLVYDWIIQDNRHI